MSIVGAAADEIGLGLDFGGSSRIHPGDHALDLGHHFGADAVAGEQQKFVGHALRVPMLERGPEKLLDVRTRSRVRDKEVLAALPNGRAEC